MSVGETIRSFEFATAARIIFGAGSIRQLPELAREFGGTAFVVTGGSARAKFIQGPLAATGVRCDFFSVATEPTTDLVLEGVRQAKACGGQLVIGIGGGSVIDAAKAIAGMLANEGDLVEYLEVIGRGKALSKPSLPYIAVPTTAGPGTEVTRNAVLRSKAHRVKVSLRSPYLLPRVALIDPELTYALTPELTAATGLDALTQLIEPYVSARANPLTDAICLEGIKRVGRSLWAAYEDGTNTAARANMSLASLYGGLALANAGLGAVHGFAGPIGGMYPAPHGAVCAALLPHVMGINLLVAQTRSAGQGILERYDEIGRVLTNTPQARAEDGIRWVKDLCKRLKVPLLREYGVTKQELPAICDKAAAASSMKGNPVKLTLEEMRDILERAF